MEMFPPPPTVFPAFAAAAALAHPAYRTLMRGGSEPLEINAAEGFTRRWVARHFDRTGARWQGQDDAIIDGAAAPGLCGFGLVAAAFLALRMGRWDGAATLAERAYATDQHETFAQRLFLAAGERSASLRLAVDDWLEDRFCPNPFTDVEVQVSRDVYTCCAAWLPAPIGGAKNGPRIWHGPRAAELRRSILDGDFGHCSRLSCPSIASRSLPRRAEVTDPAMRAAIDTGTVPPPQRVLLSYDTSCNLSCPSCRTKLITAGRKAAAELDAFYDESIAPLLTEARKIKVTGSGDPFGSRHFRSVLAKLTASPASAPRLQLHTNGVLFDEKAWEDLRLETHVRSVWISIDAAEAETYAILRRDGDFDRLMRNLRFLGELRAEDRIGQLRLDFVVQAENFRQMPAFVALAQAVGADGTHFLMLRNWGTFTPEVYRTKAVANPTHPEFAELLAVLADPCFDAPGVDLGNLAPLRKLALGAEAPPSGFVDANQPL